MGEGRSGLPKWGGDLGGWGLREGERDSLEGILLGALADDAYADDPQARASAWWREHSAGSGYPAYMVISAGICMRVAIVRAVADGYHLDPDDAEFLVRAELGTHGYKQRPDGTNPRITRFEASGRVPVVFERCPEWQGLPWPDLWRRLSGPADADKIPSEDLVAPIPVEEISADGLPWDNPVMVEPHVPDWKKHDLEEVPWGGWVCRREGCGETFSAPEGWGPWEPVPDFGRCPAAPEQHPEVQAKIEAGKQRLALEEACDFAYAADKFEEANQAEDAEAHDLWKGRLGTADRCGTCDRCEGEAALKRPAAPRTCKGCWSLRMSPGPAGPMWRCGRPDTLKGPTRSLRPGARRCEHYAMQGPTPPAETEDGRVVRYDLATSAQVSVGGTDTPTASEPATPGPHPGASAPSAPGVDSAPSGDQACQHPWHGNPGLISQCPECDEGARYGRGDLIDGQCRQCRRIFNVSDLHKDGRCTGCSAFCPEHTDIRMITDVACETQDLDGRVLERSDGSGPPVCAQCVEEGKAEFCPPGCADCAKKVPDKAAIKDKYGVRRCGVCHRKHHMGGEQADGDVGVSEPLSTSGDQPQGRDQVRGVVLEPAAGIADAETPLRQGSGSRSASPGVETRPISALGETKRPEGDPDPGPEEKDEPENGVELKRWDVSCPACPRHQVVAEEPAPSAACPDCGFWPLFVKACGGEARSFDWPRILAKLEAPRATLEQPARCRVCSHAMGVGVKVLQHERNRETVAHVRCVENALGAALTLLREGKIQDGSEHENCCLCMDTLGAGEVWETEHKAAHRRCVEGDILQPPLQEDDRRDPCAWNPKSGRFAKRGDAWHGPAEILVGMDRIRLCRSCRKLPPWRRKRREVKIGSPERGSPSPSRAASA